MGSSRPHMLFVSVVAFLKWFCREGVCVVVRDYV